MASIEPIYDTNWSDMPDDIKLECIGKMKFTERLSLRCTAKAERSLVDSQKIKFTSGRFEGNHDFLGFELSRDNECEFWMRSKDLNKGLELVKYVKKIGLFESLTFSSIYFRSFEEEFFNDDELFTVKHIKFNEFDINQVVIALRKMKNGVESIKIESALSDDIGQILAISHVQNVPYWHITECRCTNSLHKVAQMWIDKNSTVGSTFQASMYEDGWNSFEEFLDQFDDRIISKSDKRTRIRTNNPDRHILLERGVDDVITIDNFTQFYRLMVISADLGESEYDDNCKEWICKIYPGMHVYDW
ncbi:hypothetical protein L5515_010538 [Caenorhabditis briggsae]|uniref:F-box domain-containing protein n=1 Tax=Caenorhabditis briggsae TaxID=6238 RepID=A0AAE9EQI2_CAEBR|nr:hypothetical protein L5515_010538 [Caenorhabditis briggsae]